jgi:hypothetical protein
VTGGGDCRRLADAAKSERSWLSLSAVPGGVGSWTTSNEVVFTDGVRLCRVKYDVDRGSSGLAETGLLAWFAYPYEDRRLSDGD